MVLVDTPVWLVALRRKIQAPTDEPVRLHLQQLIRRGEAQLLGLVRQELLSGVRQRDQFTKLRDHLRRFPDIRLNLGDYENAAELSNQLRSAGIASSPVDILLCSVSISRQWQIFSTDLDFARYAEVIPIRLFRIS